MNVSGALDEWAAGYRAMFERMHHTLARANHKARHLTVTVTSADGGVTVTVGADRLVRDVVIEEKAYRTYDESTLARLVVDACRHAKRGVTRATWQVIDREFGVGEDSGQRGSGT